MHTKGVVLVKNIYLFDISPLSDIYIFNKYYNNCPQYRKDKIDTLKNKTDRMLSLGAEILLSFGMADLDIYEYNILTSESGKPYAQNLNIQFNLSHSGKYAAAAFSDKAIGIDIETPRKINPGLTKRYFSEAELKHFETCDKHELEFLKIWTRKESLLKATGIGISTKLSEICVLNDTVTFNGTKYTITTTIEDGHILSVACEGKNEKIIPERIIVM